MLFRSYKGFQELNKLLKLERELPKMIGVQAEGCSPIAKAFAQGDTQVVAEENPKTIAGGIGDGLYGYAGDGTYTLNIIRESGGFCIDVSDEEISVAQKELAVNEGVFVEPSAATSLAALKKSFTSSDMKDKSVLLLLTGHGLKESNDGDIENKVPVIPNNVEALKSLLND